MAEEERRRCGECKRLYPKAKPPLFSPICKLCKRPIVKSGKFWVCSNLDMSHRGLIPPTTIEKAAGLGRKPHETFEV